jgi:TetR/AcrR family fatty acid metabolism transcriptional regulator
LWSKRDFARVLTLEIFRNMKFYSTPGYQCYQDYLEKIRQVVRKGQEEGIFVKDVSLTTYLHMITGTTDQYLISHFLLGRPMAEIPELNNIVDLLVRAVKVGDDS